MTRKSDNQHVEATPHFDGIKESVINDSTASAGNTIGIQVNVKEEFAQESNPFNYLPKQNKEMKQFEELLRGKKIEE